MHTSLRYALLLSLTLAVGLADPAAAQERSIRGQVTDADTGVPLPGVNVLAGATEIGTATNAEGRYSLTVPATVDSLFFSFIGYERQAVPIAGRTVIDVQLAPAVEQLDDVVVTALGIERQQRALGYSVQEVEGEELAQVPETNFLSSLQGQVAGAQFFTSNNMGGSTRIVLRGPNSLLGNNQPLIVVDGVPISNANLTSYAQTTGNGGYDWGNAASVLNAADIQSVTVLKGPTAAALYGSRAANGVIQITTKSGAGTEGIGVTVNTSLMASRAYGLPDYQNLYGGGSWAPFTTLDGDVIIDEMVDAPGDGTDELVPDQFVVDYATDKSWGPRLDGRPARQWYSWDDVNGLMGQATPWVAHPNNVANFFRPGLTWNTTVGFSQGADNYNYRLSLATVQETGIFPNAYLDRKQLSFNGGVDLTDALRVNVVANYITEDGRARPRTGYAITYGGALFQFNHFGQRQVDLGPGSYMRDYRRRTGQQRGWNWQGVPGAVAADFIYTGNPYWQRFESIETDDSDRLFGKIQLAYDLAPSLTLSTQLVTDYFDTQRQERTATGSIDPDGYNEENLELQETKIQGRLSFDQQLDEDWSLDAFAATEYRHESITDLSGYTLGGLSAPNVYTVGNSVARPIIDDSFSEKGVFSVFGATTIGWRDLLYLDLTARNDWTSTLPAENNSYFYPSASLSFVFSSLPALQGADVLSFGKLRLAYARVGSDTAPYQLENIFPVGLPFDGRPVQSRPNQLSNATLKPELTTSWEVGTTLQFFNNRLGLDATYYYESTRNQIIPVQITEATGFSSTLINAGEITNRGLELSLRATPVVTQSLQWNVSLNYAKNVNEVVELTQGLEQVTIGGIPWGPDIQARVGASYGALFGTDFVYDANGNKVLGASGQYLESDPTVLGSYLPDWTWGASSTLSYEGFTLSVQLDGQMGGSIFSMNNHWGLASGMMQETAANGVRELGVNPGGVWFPQNYDDNPANDVNNIPGDDIPNFSESVGVPYDQRIDAVLFFDSNFQSGPRALVTYDATYVKLRELTLGYTLPGAWLAGTPIRRFTFSLIGRNLATLYKETPNFDPATAISASNVQGFELGQVPPQRAYGVSLRLTL